jgi:hypothetical protein
MAIINNENEVLHRAWVKLYPNYLPKVEGAYIALTDSGASYGRGSLRRPQEPVRLYRDTTTSWSTSARSDETAYQLCDGFAMGLSKKQGRPLIFFPSKTADR